MGLSVARASSLVRAAGRAVGELVFPPQCIHCGCWGLTGADGLCGQCDEKLAAERARPCCPTCAADVAPFEVKLDRCGDCRGRSLKVAGTARVGPYRGDVGGLLRAYKYHGREELGPVLAGWLTAAVQSSPWHDRVEAVVSVPTHWKRRWSRRFHAADALASDAAERLGLPHVTVLRRLRSGPHQIELSFAERVANIRGAFALAEGVSLRGARLLLVDDVRTTGATLEECAMVLRRGGAAEVYAAVVVRVSGVGPGDARLSAI